MTPTPRPEKVEDLPDSDRYVDAVNITWPSSDELLRKPTAYANLRQAIEHLTEAFSLITPRGPVRTASMFTIAVPRHISEQESMLAYRQREWDKAISDADDIKVGGTDAD